MAELIRVQNFGVINIRENTRVAVNASAGQAVLVVKNASGFVAEDFVRIGAGEQAEIAEVLSVTGQNITLTGNLSFRHLRGERVIKLFGDQISIFRATNTDGSVPPDNLFAEIATIAIRANQLYTDYLDTGGGAGFWYKFVYRNSVSSVTTNLADSIANRGGDFGHYVTIEEIRTEAGFQHNPDVTDQMIYDRRSDAESEIRGVLYNAGYALPLVEPIPSIVKNITKLLAAGYLLLQDYGVLQDGTNKEGDKKIELAQILLGKIRSREIVILDDIGEIPFIHRNKISGWPNDRTATTSAREFGGKRKASMSDKF